MLRIFTAVFAISIFLCVHAGAQVAPNIFLPCKPQFRAGSNWVEIERDYGKQNKRVPPMTYPKRCDMIFLRSTDSVRIRISFCHEKPKATALAQHDTIYSKTIGQSNAQFTRIRVNGRVLYHVEVNSKGCSHAWGTLVRENELPAIERFLQDLSMDELHD